MSIILEIPEPSPLGASSSLLSSSELLPKPSDLALLREMIAVEPVDLSITEGIAGSFNPSVLDRVLYHLDKPPKTQK